MVADYYYLVSSLPELQLEAPPLISREEFLSLCEEQLTDRDLSIMQALVSGVSGTGGSETAAQWVSFSDSLDAELASQRAQRMNLKDQSSYIPQELPPASIVDLVAKAMSDLSPLESERLLDEARLAFLDELAVNHHFDLTRIIVYYLKLTILDREQSFEFDRGDAEFRRLLSNIQTSIRSY